MPRIPLPPARARHAIDRRWSAAAFHLATAGRTIHAVSLYMGGRYSILRESAETTREALAADFKRLSLTAHIVF